MKITDLKTGKRLGYEDCFCLKPYVNESKLKLFLRRNKKRIVLLAVAFGIGWVIASMGF